MSKTNKFFQNTTTTTYNKQQQQQQQTKQQQQQQEQQFHLALPIVQNNNKIQQSNSSSSSSSSYSSESESTNSSSSQNNNPSSSTKTNLNPTTTTTTTIEQSPCQNSLIGSTLISPSTGTRYHLNRFLGQGTFSQVIQANCTPKSSSTIHHPSVALKLIKTFSSNHDESTTTAPPNLIYQDHIPSDEYQFIRLSALREIEILKSIEHPSIIKLIETFDVPTYTTESNQEEESLIKDNDNDTTTITRRRTSTIENMKKNASLKVIVLEEIRGGELFQLVSKTTTKYTLKPMIICRIMAELCIAVHWLHSNQIVHRDLKLENILLVREIKNEDSTVEEMKRNRNVYIKLTDFGLSVKMNKTGLLTSRCGSEEYAAPEIILGRKYDGRKTDVWAVGVIGYSLVTGTLPFKLPEPLNPSTITKEEDDYHSRYIKRRKQGLLRIIKSEYSWLIPNNTNTGGTGGGGGGGSHVLRNDVEGQIHLVNLLLNRDPIKRSTDLLSPFRDALWLGQFDWLKNLLLFS